MAKTPGAWTVHQHGPIEHLADNIVRVSGSLRGMSLRRTMTVVRLDDGRLIINNAIALEEPAMQEIERWGTPTFLVVPSGIHRLDAPAYKKRYPALRVFTARGARKKVDEVITVDGLYDEFPVNETARFEPIAGIKDAEGALFVRSPDGTTIVLNDVVFNMDRKRDVIGFLFTALMGSAPGPRVSRLARLALVKDKKALKANLLQLAETPNLVRLIVAHENIATGADASAALRKAATFL